MSLERIKIAFIFLSFLLLILFFTEMEWKIISEQISLIGFKFTYILLASFLGSVFSTLSWIIIFSGFKNFKIFKKFFIIRNIGESLALINPLGIAVGDSFKYILFERFDFDQIKIGSSLVISRALSIVSFVLLSTFVILMLTSNVSLGNTSYSSFVIVGLLIIVLGLIYGLVFSKRLLAYRLLNFIVRIFKLPISKSVLFTFKKMNLYCVRFFFKTPFLFVISIVLLFIHWLCGALEYFIILALLEKPISFFDAMFLEVGTSLVKNIFVFVPGQLGIEEYANKYYLGLIDVKDNSTWVIVNVLRRARQMMWLISSGFLYVFYFKFNLKRESVEEAKYSDGSIVH